MNVSHELKTPLQTLSGRSELLKNGIVRLEDVSEFSEKIYFESQRMIRLFEDIIKLSRLDEGAAGMEWGSVDLYALSGDVINSLSNAASSADVTLKLAGKSAVINGIPQLLQTMLFNLCDNSIKYKHKGSTVEIAVKNEDNFTALTVSDTGIGCCLPRKIQKIDKQNTKNKPPKTRKSADCFFKMDLLSQMSENDSPKVEKSATKFTHC